jgi:hypothetical protein
MTTTEPWASVEGVAKHLGREFVDEIRPLVSAETAGWLDLMGGGWFALA